MIGEKDFAFLADKLFASVGAGKSLILNLRGESGQFCRLNDSKIRQNGLLRDCQLGMTLLEGEKEIRKTQGNLSLTGEQELDLDCALEMLRCLETQVFPVDPWAVLPRGEQTSRQISEGVLPKPEELPAILAKAPGYPMTGVYSGGSILRACATSAGAFHWFCADSFCLDYTLHDPQRKAGEGALKGMYAGNRWDLQALGRELAVDSSRLELLRKGRKSLSPGKYRVYLAARSRPGAFVDSPMEFWRVRPQAGAFPFASTQRGGARFFPFVQLFGGFLLRGGSALYRARGVGTFLQHFGRGGPFKANSGRSALRSGIRTGTHRAFRLGICPGRGGRSGRAARVPGLRALGRRDLYFQSPLSQLE